LAGAGTTTTYRGQGTTRSPYVDPVTGDHVVIGKPYQPDVQMVDQFVGAFGDGSALPIDRSNDVLLAGKMTDAELDAVLARVRARRAEVLRSQSGGNSGGGSRLQLPTLHISPNGHWWDTPVEQDGRAFLSGPDQSEAETARLGRVNGAAGIADRSAGGLPDNAASAQQAQQDFRRFEIEQMNAAAAPQAEIKAIEPSFWERTWGSPEVQHVMGNTITGKVVGGIANFIGTGISAFRDDGYNPATLRHVHGVARQRALEDTVIGLATLPVGGARPGIGSGSTPSVLSARVGTRTGPGWKTFADNEVFTNRASWTATRPRGTQQTYEVIQRNDIDWGMTRTDGPADFVGRTNAEAARRGIAPQLPDGNFATLHHVGQDSRGSLAEASSRYHGVGKPGQDALHSPLRKERSESALSDRQARLLERHSRVLAMA